ncbi:MAG: S-layer homology domain-containing protein, partial [Anaerovorax sp.]
DSGDSFMMLGFTAPGYLEGKTPTEISSNVNKLGIVFNKNANYFHNGSVGDELADIGANEKNADCFTLYENGKVVPSTVSLLNSGGEEYVSYTREKDGAVGQVEEKKVIYVKPDQGLKPGTEYKLVIDKALSGNSSVPLAKDVTVYYKTAAAGAGDAGAGGGMAGGGGVVEQPVDNSLNIDLVPVISGNTAKVAPTDGDIEKAIKNSKAGQKNSVIFQVTQKQLDKAGKASVMELNLTGDQVKKLAEKVEVVVYDTPFGLVEIPVAVLKQGNGDLKLSIAKVEGEKDRFTVTLSDSKGNITSLTGRVKLAFPMTDTTNNVLSHNGTIMKNAKIEGKTAYGITKGFSTFQAEKKTVTFTDVTNHWAKSNIEFLAARDIVNGINKTQFGANQSVTRSQFVKMLVNGFDELNGVTGGSAGFDDVKEGQWYTDYINWAASKKIITGTGNGKFGTENPISRQDMAVIMDRFAKEMKISLYAKANKVTFADDSKIAPYAKDAVYTMQQAGIINGTGGNNFNPTGNATRGETAKMITMVIEAMLQ